MLKKLLRRKKLLNYTVGNMEDLFGIRKCGSWLAYPEIRYISTKRSSVRNFNKIFQQPRAETQKRDRLRRSREGDKMKKAKKENYRIVTESGKQLFNQNYTEAGANRIWEMYNGVYTDDNGNEEYIYVEKI